MKNGTLLTLLILISTIDNELPGQGSHFSNNPSEVVFHTEDITNFWKIFDEMYPNLEASTFQTNYINVGSKGLNGFLKNRIENGKNLVKTLNNNLPYYLSIRESSLSIDKKRDRFYECFRNLKEMYPAAVFPDVYFVIGVKNSGGTISSQGLIIGAEMFGEKTESFKPVLDINYVDEVVAHELVHFQQKYARSNTLLAQCIREGSADFICELIAGGHSNNEIYKYGDAHTKELWGEFLTQINDSNWTNWLYSSKDQSRPRDLGYWMGYKITKAYYTKAGDKMIALRNILHIQDFTQFLKDSGYNGE